MSPIQLLQIVGDSRDFCSEWHIVILMAVAFAADEGSAVSFVGNPLAAGRYRSSVITATP